MFICLGICPRICYEICRAILSWNLSCWNFFLKNSCFLGICVMKVSLTKISERTRNLIHSPSCRTPCRLFIHEVFFGPLGLHLRVWSERGRSPPFRPMRALRLQWSQAFQSCVWSSPKSLWMLHFKHSHWWKRRSQSKSASHYVWGTNGVCECKMDVKSTWIPIWHQMDHVSWSLGLFSKTTSWRQA